MLIHFIHILRIVVCAVGLGMLPSFSEAKRLIGIRKIFKPRPQYARMYTRNFKVFTQLYEKNKELLKQLIIKSYCNRIVLSSTICYTIFVLVYVQHNVWHYIILNSCKGY